MLSSLDSGWQDLV